MMNDRKVPLMADQLQSALRRQIGRRWAVGQQLPSIRELAHEMKAGRSNVHRAVRQLVEEGLLASRVGRGTIVLRADARDADDAALPSLPLAGRHVAVLRAADAFQLSAADAVVDYLSARGCRVSCSAVLHQDLESTLESHRGVDGIVYVDPPEPQPIRLPSQCAVVLIGATHHVQIEGPAAFDTVEADSVRGAQLAGAHARRMGCRTAGYLAVHPKHLDREMDPTCAERLRGFEAGFGAAVPNELQLVCNRYQISSGARAADVVAHWKPLPDVLFAASDDLAVGFAQRAAELGIEIGKTIQLIGFDGQRRGREMPGGPLTTIDIPMGEIGRAAATMMTDRLMCPDTPSRTMRMACSLYQGATTRPRRSRTAPKAMRPAYTMRHGKTS